MTETESHPAVRIRDLDVRFGAVHAVAGLSLDIGAGSLVGLLGPNGAGKTTTISCLAGIVRPTGGQLLVDGMDVAREPRRVKRTIGVVPQSLALYPTLSVVANLRLFGGLFGVRAGRLNERIEWGLELARLQTKRGALVGALSGGMQRRLNLACALLHDPKIIVCDEPTTGVDPQSRNHIFETIRRLHGDGRTIIYTTHYMEEVEALCDRVAIMDHGKILVEDRLDRLLCTAASSRRFDVELVKGGRPEEIETALRSGGLEVGGVRAERADLEQVFLDLTGRGLRDDEESSEVEKGRRDA